MNPKGGPKLLASSYKPVGVGRDQIESTFVAGYEARLTEERDELARSWRESMIARRIFDLMHLVAFVMVAYVFFGQVPMEKAIQAVTTKYKEAAEFTVQQDVCGRVAAQREPYASYMRDAFIIGCLWDTQKNIMEKFKGKPKELEKYAKIFEDHDTPEFLEFANQCEKGAADLQLQGFLEDRIVLDLWKNLKCDKLQSGGKENEDH